MEKQEYKPAFEIKDLFEASVHYGHKTAFWNPKMKPYIYGEADGIYIIDLVKTYHNLNRALSELYHLGRQNKRILFVGTKPQCSKLVKKYAIECGQYYINHRWLGGTLTNWKTIASSIKTLEDYERKIREESTKYTKNELIGMTRNMEKLEKNIGGIRQLNGKPDAIFVIDAQHESIAIAEANKMNIHTIAVVDTNTNPAGVDLVIPGNDDSTKASELYLRLASEAILRGIQDGMKSTGVDISAYIKKPKAKS
jgi:small subunit ribosomal protein S2